MRPLKAFHAFRPSVMRTGADAMDRALAEGS